MTDAILYSTDNYIMRVGDSLDFDHAGEEPRAIYQLVNIYTEVIEREELVYAQAVALCRGLDEAYKKMEQTLKEEEEGFSIGEDNVITLN